MSGAPHVRRQPWCAGPSRLSSELARGGTQRWLQTRPRSGRADRTSQEQVTANSPPPRPHPTPLTPLPPRLRLSLRLCGQTCSGGRDNWGSSGYLQGRPKEKKDPHFQWGEAVRGGGDLLPATEQKQSSPKQGVRKGADGGVGGGPEPAVRRWTQPQCPPPDSPALDPHSVEEPPPPSHRESSGGGGWGGPCLAGLRDAQPLRSHQPQAARCGSALHSPLPAPSGPRRRGKAPLQTQRAAAGTALRPPCAAPPLQQEGPAPRSASWPLPFVLAWLLSASVCVATLRPYPGQGRVENCRENKSCQSRTGLGGRQAGVLWRRVQSKALPLGVV